MPLCGRSFTHGKGTEGDGKGQAERMRGGARRGDGGEEPTEEHECGGRRRRLDTRPAPGGAGCVHNHECG